MPGEQPFPARIDRYDVLGELARGGMARVLVVRRSDATGFDRVLALKTVLSHLATEQEYLRMFFDEARIASRVEHKNAVQVFDVGEHEGVPYLVMELLRGQPLGRVVRKLMAEPELDSVLRRPNVVALLLAQAAEGLHAAHEIRDPDGTLLEVVHRDVSPQNLHVGYDGTVKVLDFGIARAMGKLSTTRTGEVKGKFAYMAPEQIARGATVDRRADIWALGVIAWELLAGRRLFTGDEAQIIWSVMNDEVPSLSRLRPELPAGLVELVHACLERARELRPSTADELATELWRLSAEGEPVHARVLGDGVALLCATERAKEEERLSMLLRSGPVPVIDPSSASDQLPTHRDVPPTVARPRRAQLAIAALALTAVGVGSWLAWSNTTVGDGAVLAAPRGAPSPERVAAPEPPVVPEAETPAAVTEVAAPSEGSAEPPAEHTAERTAEHTAEPTIRRAPRIRAREPREAAPTSRERAPEAPEGAILGNPY